MLDPRQQPECERIAVRSQSPRHVSSSNLSASRSSGEGYFVLKFLMSCCHIHFSSVANSAPTVEAAAAALDIQSLEELPGQDHLLLVQAFGYSGTASGSCLWYPWEVIVADFVKGTDELGWKSIFLPNTPSLRASGVIIMPG